MATVPTDENLLAIYLNDHLAGMTAVAERARRLAESDGDQPGGAGFRSLATDMAADADALRAIMTGLGLSIRRYKSWAAMLAEKLGAKKLNGSFLARSPLSRVVDLEALRLGADAAATTWQTLRALAETDARLNPDRFDQLLRRTTEQADLIERLRASAATQAFGGRTTTLRFGTGGIGG